MVKLSKEFKESVEKGFDVQMERLQRPMNKIWTIGDGREYYTKQEAEIAYNIHKNGGIDIDWVLDDNKRVIALERLVEDNILRRGSDKDYPFVEYSFGTPKVVIEEEKNYMIDVDQEFMDLVEQVLKGETN